MKEIEEKNQKLLDYKIDSGKIGTQLLEAKRELNNNVSKISRYQREIEEKEKILKEIMRSQQETEKKKLKLNEKKRGLIAQAEQMKSPTNSDIPNVKRIVNLDNGVCHRKTITVEVPLREEKSLKEDYDCSVNLRES